MKDFKPPCQNDNNNSCEGITAFTTSLTELHRKYKFETIRFNWEMYDDNDISCAQFYKDGFVSIIMVPNSYKNNSYLQNIAQHY